MCICRLALNQSVFDLDGFTCNKFDCFLTLNLNLFFFLNRLQAFVEEVLVASAFLFIFVVYVAQDSYKGLLNFCVGMLVH